MSQTQKEYSFSILQRLGGEFIIIVLGVLAAFAVDGWSEDRENRALEESYLLRLKDDLQWDIGQIGPARWAAFAKARATTTLLNEIGDPLADAIPTMTESAKAIDFSVPATEVISVEHKGELIWLTYRDRTLRPRRATYDEMIATGRFLVIENEQLRASIIEYYSSVEDADKLADWIDEGSRKLSSILEPTGLTPFDYNYVDDPLPKLRDLEGLAIVLRDIRWRSLRHVYLLEQVKESQESLDFEITEYLKNR